MRYTQNADSPDWETLAKHYLDLIGCLVSKSGPITVTVEDWQLYKFSELQPYTFQNEDSSLDVFLLSADERAVMQETGRNPRD